MDAVIERKQNYKKIMGHTARKGAYRHPPPPIVGEIPHIGMHYLSRKYCDFFNLHKNLDRTHTTWPSPSHSKERHKRKPRVGLIMITMHDEVKS